MKITHEGWAVVEGDQLLSRYVEEKGRLDVALEILELVHSYIIAGAVVADIGACIGDHTITYSDWVGEDGMVVAFEPNPLALECLLYNLRNRANVYVHRVALGRVETTGSLVVDRHNIGATRLVHGGGDIAVSTLDHIAAAWKRLDFVKIDAEGSEPLILDGAVETLTRLRPVILVEVNLEMLGHLHFTAEDIYSRLSALNYSFPYSGEHAFDLLAIPKEQEISQ